METTDTKYYSNKQNAVRAARKVLGAAAKPHVDFYLLGGASHWQWQVRDAGPMAEVATERGEEPTSELAEAVYAADAEQAVQALAQPGIVEAPAETDADRARFASFERMGERMSAECKAEAETQEVLDRVAAPTKARPNKMKELGTPPLRERKPNAGLVILVQLMKRPEGTTLAEAQKLTGWLPHTIRSRIAVDVVRKQGHKVQRVRVQRSRENHEAGAVSVYRIVE
jgi:hypothetical protein